MREVPPHPEARLPQSIAGSRLCPQKWPSNAPENTPENTPSDRAHFGANSRAESGADSSKRHQACWVLAPSPTHSLCDGESTSEFPAHALTTMRRGREREFRRMGRSGWDGRGYGLNRWVTVWSQEMGSRSARTWSHCLRTWVTVLSEGAPRRKSNACAGRDAHALEGDLSRG